MFKIVADLLLHGQLVLEKGKILLFGQKIIMVPFVTLKELYISLAKTGSENLIYVSAKSSGKIWYAEMYKNYKINKNDILKWSLDIISLAGYGVTDMTKFDMQKRVMSFTLVDPSVLQDRMDYLGVHLLLRGYAAGAGILVFGEDSDCIETKCMCRGEPFCEFIVMPKSSFDKSFGIASEAAAHGLVNK